MSGTRALKGFCEGLIPTRLPSWSKHPTGVKKEYRPTIDRASVPQLNAMKSFVNAANGARGATGKAPYKGVAMPAVAVRIASTVQHGVGVHGGKSPQTRRAESQAASQNTLSAIDAAIQRKQSVGVTTYARQMMV